MPVIVLVADGARLDALSGDLADLPALAQLRAEGGLHAVTSVFPSVTGAAYAPFLMGRFPGSVGIPGLRWYDRARVRCGWPDRARSYVGYQYFRFDGDLDRAAPTLFELVPHSVAALSVITRGLARERRVGTLSPGSFVRGVATHFSGKVDRWLDLDREVADTITRRVREERPDYVFAAFTGADKASHARGHDSALARNALGIVDDAAGRLRADAERGGWWKDTHLWVVSDHGHSSVHSHEDLAGIVSNTGRRTVSHPWSAGFRPEAAVMVSGNAMAHVYVSLGSRARPWWKALATPHADLAAALLARPSVDLMLLPHSTDLCEVRSASHGSAFLSRDGVTFRYERASGDPLRYGADLSGAADDVHDATRESDYPDAIVQALALAGSTRAGDMILSATPGWDLRARYEPIPHLSAHGSLHRDHMMVPLLANRRPAKVPRRTTDVFASALAALRVPEPGALDGRSFV